MIEIILWLAVLSFIGIFFSMLLQLRKFEIENKKLRQEIIEKEYKKIKMPW